MRLPTALVGLAGLLAVALGLTAVAASRRGLEGRVWTNPEWRGTPAIETTAPRPDTSALAAHVAEVVPGGSGVSARWQGILQVDRPGQYDVIVEADDVAWLYVDGRLRLNAGTRGPSRHSAPVDLTAGGHEIEVAFFNDGGAPTLEISWAWGEEPAAPIGADRLFPTRTAWRAHDALWGQAYLVPLAGSLLLFVAACWWPVGHIRRHCAAYADDPGASRALWLLLAVSLVLTLVGIGWGLPDQFGWAPDELTPIDLNKGVEDAYSGGWFLKYPPLQLYLLTLLGAPFYVGSWLGAVDVSGGAAYTSLFVLARLTSVAMGAGAVYVIYLCELELHGSRRAGLAAAALVALMPPWIYYAKMANVDVPYLFWFALSLRYYIRLVRHDRDADYVPFALLAALAVITKDQAYGFYLLPVAHLVWRRTGRLAGERDVTRLAALLGDRPLRWAALTGLGVFALGHNLLFNFDGFSEHVTTLTGPLSQESRQFPPTLAGHVTMAWEAVKVLALCLGIPGLLVCLAGLGASVRARGGRDLYLLLPALSYYLTVISVVMYHYDRFFLGVCFSLALFGGPLLADGLAGGRWAPWRRTAVGALFAYMLAAGISVDVAMAGDSRYTVERWLSDPSHAGGRIGIPGMPIYLPRVAPERALLILESPAAVRDRRPRFILVNRGYTCRAEPGSSADAFYARLRDGSLGYRLSLTYRHDPAWPLVGPDRVWRAVCDDPFTVLAKINPEIQVFERVGG